MIINHNLIGSEFITTTNNTLKSTEKNNTTKQQKNTCTTPNMHIPRNKIHKRRNKKILKIKNTINIKQNDNSKLNITNMPNIQRTKSL